MQNQNLSKRLPTQALLSMRQFAERANMPVERVEQLVNEGRVQSVMVGGQRMVDAWYLKGAKVLKGVALGN